MLNKFWVAPLLILAISCMGGGSSSKGDPAPTPTPIPTPAPTSFGTFRPLKASTTMVTQAVNGMDTGANPSITMSTPRSGHKAVDLGGGKILLFGGEDGQATSTFDIFDSETERFTALPVQTSFHRTWKSGGAVYSMIRLSTGKVLIAGGISNTQDIVEVFDPETQTIEKWNGVFIGASNPNNFENMIQIDNNRVFLYGMVGAYSTGSYLCGNGILNIRSRSAMAVITPEKAIRGGAVKMPDGSILLVGGGNYNSNGVFVSSDSIYRFDPATLKTTLVGHLRTPRQDFGITLLPDGNVGVYGGVSMDADRVVTRYKTVEILTLASSTECTTTYSTDLPDYRCLTISTVLQNGFVLNAGGGDREGWVADTEFVHNNVTQESGTTGSLNTPRRFYSIVPLSNGRLLISGGYGRSSDSFTTAEIYDPATKLFISYDTPLDQVVGGIIHFSSNTTGVTWACDNTNGEITSDGTFTAKTIGQVTVTGTSGTTKASVTVTITAPAE